MSFYRDTYLEIDLDCVRENVVNLRRYFFQNLEVMAVVKADSYGHGAVMIARELSDLGIRHLAVATVDEALELRNNGIQDADILIFGRVNPEHLFLCELNRLTVSVNSLAWINFAQKQPGFGSVAVHLKIDSGMNRLGLSDPHEIDKALKILREDPRFLLRGIYSHLATSEEPDESFYHAQVSRFEDILQKVDTTGLWIHVANSGGSIKPPPAGVNMVRIGLFLNGHLPGPEVKLPFEIKPSLSLHTKLIQVKTVSPHSKIGYNGTYETTKETIIGTLPIGYADGYDRRLKKGWVYIGGKYAQVVGRVCMDMTMVELPEWFPEGEAVELIGPHIPLESYCEWVGTSNYHATCAFSDRLPRVYKKDGNIVQIVNKRVHNQI